MTFDALAAALRETGIPFAEGAWRDAGKLKSDYGVYALDGGSGLMAGNRHAERAFEGTVDLFARNSDGRRQAALVEAAMDTAEVAWRLNSIQYENTTGYTHWEWVFQCLT